MKINHGFTNDSLIIVFLVKQKCTVQMVTNRPKPKKQCYAFTCNKMQVVRSLTGVAGQLIVNMTKTGYNFSYE